MIEKRIFVVGCPRSGTTLLQGLLGSSEYVATFPETHFFARAYPMNPLRRLLTWPSLNVWGYMSKWLRYSGYPEYAAMDQGRLFEKDYASGFVAILDAIAEQAGKPVWLEKTPDHLFCTEKIGRAIPGAKFLVIVRRGEDVVTSLYKATHDSPLFMGRRGPFPRTPFGLSIRGCVSRWNTAMIETMSVMDRPDCHVVRYEELVDSTDRTVQEISAFLGIGRIDTDGGNDVFSKIVLPIESWKANNAEPVQLQQSLFSTLFTAHQQELIVNSLVDNPFYG